MGEDMEAVFSAMRGERDRMSITKEQEDVVTSSPICPLLRDFPCSPTTDQLIADLTHDLLKAGYTTHEATMAIAGLMGSIVAGIDAAQATIHPEIVAQDKERKRSDWIKAAALLTEVSRTRPRWPPMRDPYEVLWRLRAAGAWQIKAAFRKRSKATHPDHGGSSEEFAAVVEAYDILRDPEKRAAYDRGEYDPRKSEGPPPIEVRARGMMRDMVTYLLEGAIKQRLPCLSSPQPDQGTLRKRLLRATMVAMDRARAMDAAKVADDLRTFAVAYAERSPPKTTRCSMPSTP